MEVRHSKLITKEKDGAMRIDHDALRQVLMRPEIGDSPIAIISIAGCMRTGKSFLLNFVERYFRNKGWENPNWIGDGQTSVNVGNGTGLFFWKSGRKRATTGVRISTDVFKIPRKDGGQVAVLLMDTQGLFDHETPEDVNVTLLTLSTLMSSVQIFNAKDHLNSQHLRYLKACVNFAMATAQAREPYFLLQDLIFLVRDFPEDEEIDPKYDSPYGFEYGEEYLTGIIDSKEGGDEQIAIRQRIKECFSKVKCFPMPYPGEKVNKKGFVGRNDELEAEFKQYVKLFVEEIAHPDRLQAKIAKKYPLGKEMTAREILNMVTACDNIFAMKMFEAHSMMEANVKAYYASEYEEAILIYDQMMKEAFDGSKAVAEEDIQHVHVDAKRQALRRYNTSQKMGDGNVEKFYREHLEKICDQHLKSVTNRNNTKHREQEAEKNFKTAMAFSEYESKMQKYSPEPVEDSILRERHDRHLAELIKKYGSKVDETNLREKAEVYFAILLNLNEKQRNSGAIYGEDQRRRELHRLTVELHSKCAKSWTENLKTFQPNENLGSHSRNLRKEISAEYYQKALTPVENKYINRLNGAMKGDYTKAKIAIRQGNAISPCDHVDLTEDLSRLELEQKHEEKKCLGIAIEVAKNYAGELQNDVKNGISIEQLKKEKEPKQNYHRKKYCGNCSEHLAQFYDEVEEMLAVKFEDAKKRNDENWEMMRNKMIAIIDSTVLDEEQGLEAKMDDRYIDEDELANHFKEIKKNITENIGLKLLDFKSPHVADEFKKLANEKVDASLKKMQEKNENNKEVRNVQSTEIQRSTSWWMQLWEAIKNLVGLA